MGFLTPSVPKPVPQANAAVNPSPPKPDEGMSQGAAFSPFTASPAALKRKSELNKTSLIGGG